ncbi:MAG: ABC transporter ATP-binding protein [Deltaproteobacteria bacterium]|nr:ABC transporter ATP-binding protein [Deltaproteobacteria bacterium]
MAAAAGGAPLIETVGLARRYALGDATVHALVDATLRIDAGELVAIVGPSGSGKSTLMNLLGCLDRPTAGVYRLDGREVGGLDGDARAEIRNRRIGFVFQSFNLLARTTALENVELPLYYGPLPLAEQRPRAEAALARVGIAHRAHHVPSRMSGGEQQRVAIARALVGDPALVLADEPTGNLDSRTSGEIMTMLVELNRATGVTMVIVTHDPEVAAATDRVLEFRDGRIVADTPAAPRHGARTRATRAEA